MTMVNAIEGRYAELAGSECCLSCGSAASVCDARPGQVCVDLGSGRGTDVLKLAELVGPTGHAFGIDATEAMIERAKKTAAKLGVQNATFLRSSFERTELPSASVDWVVSNCALNHASNKPAVWQEIARILRPGGQFVISDIYAVEQIPEEYANDPAAVAECWAGAVTKPEYLASIAAAGLEVRVLEESRPYSKGKSTVASFTISGQKPGAVRCC